MSPTTAYLGLDSNLGDRKDNLRKALTLISKAVRIIAVSSVYETEPWGDTDQSPFLNMACAVETDMDPPELLAHTKQVERRLGREPTFRYGPRSMDVDILLFGNVVLETPELTVPHRDMVERAFVLVPLAEIAPQVLHPVLAATIGRLLGRVSGRETVVMRGRLASQG